MDGTPAKKLARDQGIPIERLMAQLKEAGIAVSGEDDLISGNDQLKLLQHMRANESKDEPGKEVTLSDIGSSADLRELNQLLTQAMAERKIQALIKDSNLDSVVEKVVELNQETDEHELLSAGILGRLAAVARGREKVIFDRADEIFSGEPESIETLEDGDAKSYAATVISHCSDPWTRAYSYREALVIDTADNARRELLAANLARETSLADWLSALSEQAGLLKDVSKTETRYRRARRLATVLADIVGPWRGDLGEDPGGKLSRLMKSVYVHGLDDVDFSIVVEGVDALLAILRRCIELRFSMAMYPELYAILVEGRHALGAGLWGRYLERSETLGEVRHALLEASLVLARQDKFDNDMMAVLRAAFSSRAQMTSAITRHFADAKDLDPTVAEWWCKGGGGEGDKEQKAQRIRNSEDEKIGELLLKVEESQSVMEKLRSAVLPILQPLNPVLAKTVAKAASDYRETAQVIRSLSRMRQLKPAGLKSERMEYNRRLHDMDGGHRSGVRHVRVVRDGVEKTFAGKTRMLVKPIVAPEE
ncbi:MAG: hypothetical protein K9M02_01545 [Thiohalocapsa sp.]|nr:hypothetical protein [Thiohalocapsa sp.]